MEEIKMMSFENKAKDYYVDADGVINAVEKPEEAQPQNNQPQEPVEEIVPEEKEVSSEKGEEKKADTTVGGTVDDLV